jgi:Pectate lyase superfamily protein/Right handed beta helix region
MANPILTFPTYKTKPILTATDAGKFYINEATGTLFQWLGAEWKAYDRDVFNIKDSGAIGDGIADDGAAINAAITLAKNSSTIKTVFFPVGTYKVTGAISIGSIDKIKFLGQDANRVTIINSTAGSPAMNIFYATDLSFEKLGFKSLGNYQLAFTHCANCLINECKFELESISQGIYSDGCPQFTVSNSTFYSLGKKQGQGINISANSPGWKIFNNTFRYLGDAILARSACKITNNFFDGGFYTAVGDFNGTGTFTATTLTDSTAAFTGLDPGAFTIRALSLVATNNFAFNGNKITDASKDFIALGIFPGSIVYTNNCFAIVASVTTTTMIVEEWLSITTRLPVIAASETNYKVYKTWIGRCINSQYSATQITVSCWWLLNGDIATPPNGSIYEICAKKGNYQILVDRFDDNITITENIIKRPYADAISVFCSSFLVENNDIYHTQDMGITIQPGINVANFKCKGIVNGNLIRRAGASGIYVGYVSQVAVTNNRIDDTALVMVPFPGAVGSGIIVEQAKDCVVDRNTISKTISTKLTKGVAIDPTAIGTLGTNYALPPLT